MIVILLVILIAFALAGGPYTGWHQYGWWPSSTAGIILIILIVLVLAGRL